MSVCLHCTVRAVLYITTYLQYIHTGCLHRSGALIIMVQKVSFMLVIAIQCPALFTACAAAATDPYVCASSARHHAHTKKETETDRDIVGREVAKMRDP